MWHLIATSDPNEILPDGRAAMAMMRTDRPEWRWMMDDLPGEPLWDLHFDTEQEAIDAIEMGRLVGTIYNCGCFVIRDNGLPIPGHSEKTGLPAPSRKEISNE